MIFLQELKRLENLLKQKLSDDIEVGVKNGYTVEQQIELLKRVLTKFKCSDDKFRGKRK